MLVKRLCKPGDGETKARNITNWAKVRGGQSDILKTGWYLFLSSHGDKILKSVRKSSFNVGNIVGKAVSEEALSIFVNMLEGVNFGLTTRLRG